MIDYNALALALHEKHRGKLSIASKIPLESYQDLSVAYTPGVAEPCRKIFENPDDVYRYTVKGNFVAVVSDGSAVLGLGNIGGAAGLPVMEGKALLFKKFADIDAVPIVLASQDREAIIQTVKMIAPTFGAILLEDIAAPQCFEIEDRLRAELSIPVFHDDQHGTAVVLLAALINAFKITGRTFEKARIVINGAGAAGWAIARILLDYGAPNIVLVDTKGAIYEGRSDLTPIKEVMAKRTNRTKMQGALADVVKGADVLIGVSKKGLFAESMIQSMAKDPIIFAMANPSPEIMPDEAKRAGAAIVGTGRSDFPNQVNNVLAFPGLFRGALDCRAKQITEKMKLAAAEALAAFVKNPTPEKIIPGVFEQGLAVTVAKAVMAVA